MISAIQAKELVDCEQIVVNFKDLERNIEYSCSLGLSNTNFVVTVHFAPKVLEELINLGYSVWVSSDDKDNVRFDVEW